MESCEVQQPQTPVQRTGACREFNEAAALQLVGDEDLGVSQHRR